MPKIASTNPSRWYSTIGEHEITQESELISLVQDAKQAQKKWAKFSLLQRKEKLEKVLHIMKQRKEEIAALLSEEMGMPIVQAREEMEYGYMYFEWYLKDAEKFLNPEITRQTDTEIHTVYHEPKGVVAAIAPWNYPFSMGIWASIQSLLAGNAVIFKTSKETILTWAALEACFKDAGFPRWVFQEIYGPGSLGEALVRQDIDFITFTGSTRVGKNLYKIAAEKFISCVMELGGSAPGIVCEDADIDAVIETIYFLRYSNSGQMCDGLKRLIVHESRYDEVVKKLKDIIESKKVGIAREETTDVGPLVSQDQLHTLQHQYQDALQKWAQVLAQAKLDPNLDGAYFALILLWNISFDMSVWKEEVFWPILPIVKFSTLEQSIELGNDTEYGLWGYVFTQNKDTFHYIAQELQTWAVQLNTLNYCIPESPFGWYKNSGIGREHGRWGFHECCNVKVLSERK